MHQASSCTRTRSGGAAELKTNFVSDKPSSWFSHLYQRDGLRGGHVIMLGADAESKATALEALRAWPGGLHMGGGVTADNAVEYLDAGASHVIVTSYVFRDGKLEEERLKGLVSGGGCASGNWWCAAGPADCRHGWACWHAGGVRRWPWWASSAWCWTSAAASATGSTGW